MVQTALFEQLAPGPTCQLLVWETVIVHMKPDQETVNVHMTLQDQPVVTVISND